MQRNKISFKGQKIFIGIDVHKKNWAQFIFSVDDLTAWD